MSRFHSFAPGRVEVLGNHTDYNDGFVLSSAVEFGIRAVGRRLDQPLLVLRSKGYAGETSLDIRRLAPSAEASWTNYPAGVVFQLIDQLPAGAGMEIEFDSDLPAGAGLSSSAALEVATAKLMEKIFDLRLSPMSIAKQAQAAEHLFAGVKCGLLDQLSSVFGKEDHLLFTDFRSLDVEEIPLPAGLGFLIIHSGTKHALVGGEYNERREQCHAAAAALGKPALRDLSSTELHAAADRLPGSVLKRALHVTGENERVLEAVEALRKGDAAPLGRAMFASHKSSHSHFENSTPELDKLVEIAEGTPGVLGARLSGGGFGGATVNLVPLEQAETIAEGMLAAYRAATGIQTRHFITRAAGGAN